MGKTVFKELDVHSLADDNPTGYILEVDLKYPDNMYDLHSDYPLSPETMAVQDPMLSPYSQQLKEHFNNKGKPTAKLITYFKNKIRSPLQKLKAVPKFGLGVGRNPQRYCIH